MATELHEPKASNWAIPHNLPASQFFTQLVLLHWVHMIGRPKHRPGGDQMKSWKQLTVTAFLLITLGGTAAMAEDRDDWGWNPRGTDLRHDYADRRADWRDISRDRASINHDYAELRRDYAVGNYWAAERERAEIHAKERDLKHDYRDIRKHNRDVRRDYHGWNADR